MTSTTTRQPGLMASLTGWAASKSDVGSNGTAISPAGHDSHWFPLSVAHSGFGFIAPDYLGIGLYVCCALWTAPSSTPHFYILCLCLQFFSLQVHGKLNQFDLDHLNGERCGLVAAKTALFLHSVLNDSRRNELLSARNPWISGNLLSRGCC